VTWMLLVALAWMVLAGVLGVVIGRGIRLADQPRSAASWVHEVEQFVRREAESRLP
jgi:hypothetical protein